MTETKTAKMRKNKRISSKAKYKQAHNKIDRRTQIQNDGQTDV